MKESFGNPNARSPVGAMGGFQFMPKTWQEWGKGSAYNMTNATEAAAKYLRYLIDKNKGNIDLALASYNAGFGNVKKYGGIPPFKETRKYVPEVNRYRAHYNGGTNPKTTQSDYANQQSNLKEQQQKSQQKSQQEIQSWFATERQKIDDEFIKKTNEIITNFSGDEQTRLLNQLTDRFFKVNRYADLKFDLDTKGDVMDKWERLAKELDVRLAGIDADMTLGEEQREAQKEQAHREQLKKSSEIVLAEKQEYLDLNRWRMSYREVLKLEKDIAIERLNAGRTSQEIQANGLTKEQQAIQDQYDFKIEQYNKEQPLKIAELEKTNQAVRQSGHYAGYLDELNKKTMGKPVYERWKLNNHYGQTINDEQSRYTDLKEQIEAKDDTGNYVIEDALERHRLLQEAEQNHLNEMHAMREEYAEKSRQIHMDSMSQTLQGYASTFGEMSNIIKAFGGEQSKSYRAMFAISKAFAVADIGIKMGQAMGQAWGDPSATTIWQKMANVAKVTLAQGHLMQIINAVSPNGFATGGYTGNIGTSQIAGVVHGQEYVMNAKATKRIGVNNLERLNNGGGIGGNTNINVNVTVNSDGSSDVQSDAALGKRFGEAIRAAVQKELHNERRQGGLLYGA